MCILKCTNWKGIIFIYKMKPGMKGAENKLQAGNLKSSLHTKWLLTWILCSKYVWFGTFIFCGFCLSDFICWGFGDNMEKIRLNFWFYFNTLITQKWSANPEMHVQLLRQWTWKFFRELWGGFTVTAAINDTRKLCKKKHVQTTGAEFIFTWSITLQF